MEVAIPTAVLPRLAAPGDTVTLSLTSSLPIWTPWLAKLFTGGDFTFTASTTFKNEPFNPSETN